MWKSHGWNTAEVSLVVMLAGLAVLGLVVLTVGLGLCQDETAPPASPSAKADDPAPAPETADEATAPDEKQTQAEEEEEPVHIENADRMQYDPEKGLYFLTGNVHFRHKDAHLYSDEAQYDEENDTARAVGKLKLVTPDTTVTGDLITADFDEEVAEITGNVRLVTQRKKEEEAETEPQAGEAEGGAEGEAGERPADEAAEAEEDEKKPKKLDEYREKLTTVTCGKIRYWYEEKRAVATEYIVAVQEDKTCYADEGTYLEEEETLTLTGDPVRVVMENGNRFQAPKITVDIAGDQVWTEGRVSGIFKREKKEEEEGEKTPPEEGPQPEGEPAPAGPPE